MSHHRPRSLVFAAVLIGFSWISAGLYADIQPDDYSLVDRWLAPRLDGLVERYEMLHSRPELSEWEVETAAMVARRLRVAGYTVHEGIGGHGVAGVLSTGAGPTLLIRGDMDALPITEMTGLPYASRVIADTDENQTVGVMHACGHDIHTIAMLGVA